MKLVSRHNGEVAWVRRGEMGYKRGVGEWDIKMAGNMSPSQMGTLCFPTASVSGCPSREVPRVVPDERSVTV